MEALRRQSPDRRVAVAGALELVSLSFASVAVSETVLFPAGSALLVRRT